MQIGPWLLFAVAASGVAAISVAGREADTAREVGVYMADMGYVVSSDLDASGSIVFDPALFEGYPDPGELEDLVLVDSAMAGTIFQDYTLDAESALANGERIDLDFGAPAFEDACCDDEESGCVPTHEPCEIFLADAADRVDRIFKA
jgi:hypothetical protein